MVKGEIDPGPDSSVTAGKVEQRDSTVLDGMVEVGAVIMVDAPEDTVRTQSDTMQSICNVRTMDSIGVAVDSVVTHRAWSALARNLLDTVKKIAVDSLKIVGGRPMGEGDIDINEGIATIYPNPVGKGGSLHLSWGREPSDGRADLFSIGGALVRTWMIRGASGTQTLSMPAEITAGTYIIRVTTKTSGYARKVMVE
jgi:hypothetical protein